MSEDKAEFREQMVARYKEILSVSPSDEMFVLSMFKVNKIGEQILSVSQEFYEGEMDVTDSLICIDILLGAAGEIKKEIKQQLSI